MDMTAYIRQYYQGERSRALLGVAIGVAFLLIGWSAWRQPSSEHLYRGLAYTMLVCSLLAVAGLGMFFQTNK